MKNLQLLLFTLCIILATPEKITPQNADNFGFYGYMRSGYGITPEGDPMVAFQAPNAEAKYRLGNEAEAYIEPLFKYSYKDENGAAFESILRLAFVTPTSKSNQFTTTTSVREAYASLRGISSKKPELAFWAGQRFYDRYDVHITDFWYRDMSGFGGGFEDLKIGKETKLAVAFLGGSIDQLGSSGNVIPQNEFTFNKATADVRVYNIGFLSGKLGLTFDYSYFKGDSVVLDQGTYSLKSSNGISFGLMHELPFEGGRNKFSAFYGTGAAENYKAIIQQPIGLTPKPGSPVEIKDMSRFRILNDLLLNVNAKYSILGFAMYQHLDNAQSTNNTLHCFSLGMRNAFHINRYFSVLAEVGADYTRQQHTTSGSLIKITLAPQLSPLNEILSRPAVRAFVTYAAWSDDFKGMVGTPAFGNDTSGVVFGIQMETWW
jgi:maltoporin